MSLKFALAGNPNCGKTTLFNRLTKSHAHVGNWSGVTVERREGKYNEDITIIDLPGIYSLSPYSKDEIISRDYLLNEKPNLIINIVDATNFERNIYLTSQLIETGIPIIVALNMMDEVKAMGNIIDIDKISNKLGVCVVPISASKNTGIDTLMKKAENIAKKSTIIFKTILADTDVYDIALQIRKKARNDNKEITLFSAIKLLENDEKTKQSLNLSQNTYNQIQNIIDESQKKQKFDWEIVVADLRYKYITKLTSECIIKNNKKTEDTITYKIDLIATNRILAIPLFIAIMFAVFQITFGSFGNFFTDIMDNFVTKVICYNTETFLVNIGTSNLLVRLIVDGILSGVGMVIVFLPQILLLFLFLSILEDSGYMARAAFIMDKLLRKFGLSGKSFVPLILGFGCSVPAIMATRIIENEKDRKITIILTPFMSCSARMPVYTVFASAFFYKNKGIIITSLYFLGIFIAMLCGVILKSTVLKGDNETFIMELPNYRMPSFKSVAIHVWEKAKDFIVRAFTVLLMASVIIWFLQSFNFSFKMAQNNSESIFAQFGMLLAPIFKPLGFGNWKASAALITGFIAKETVVSTLGILYGASNAESGLYSALKQNFTMLSAYSYMVFILLYMPCIAAFTAIKKEMNSWKWTLFAVLFQNAVAWIVSFIVYNVGGLF